MSDVKSQLDTGAANDARLSSLESDLEKQAKETMWVRWLMSSIVVVVFIAFIGMLFTVYGIIQQYISTETATYQKLIDKVDNQNATINSLYLQCSNEKVGPVNRPTQVVVPQPVQPSNRPATIDSKP